MIARNTAAGALKVELGPAGAERLAKAALGLTAFEAENAFARSMVDDGRLTDDDIALVQEEKRQIVQKSGVLEVVTVHRQPGRHRRAGEPEDLARASATGPGWTRPPPTACRRRRVCWSPGFRAAESR